MRKGFRRAEVENEFAKLVVKPLDNVRTWWYNVGRVEDERKENAMDARDKGGHDSTIFSDAVIDAAHELSAPITERRTQETRAAIARGESPELVGALTATDLLRWINNKQRKSKR